MRRLLVMLVVAAATLGLAGPASAGPAYPTSGVARPVRDLRSGVIHLPNLHYGGAIDLSFQHHLLDAYLPADLWNPHPGVIVIHGGGARAGDKSSIAAQARLLAEHGLAAFSINYRPVRTGTEPFDDAQAAVEWVRQNAQFFGVDPNRIGALGTSAGGHLASMLAVRTDGRWTQGSGVMAVVAWSSFMDMSLWDDVKWTSDEQLQARWGCSTPADCQAALRGVSPITFVSGDDPTLFFVHSKHEFVPVAMARRMDRRMDAVGAPHRYIELPGSQHGQGYLDRVIPGTSTTVLEASLDFLLRKLSA